MLAGVVRIPDATGEVGDMALRDFAQLLVAVWRGASQCPMMEGWCRSLIVCAAAALDKELAEPDKWSRSAENAPALRGPKRRMRLGQDLLAAAAGQMVTSKRFKSAACVARSGALDIHANTAKVVEGGHVQRYMAATMDVFSQAKQVHITTDASTVGGESTMVTAMYSHSVCISAWAVPQAMGGHLSQFATLAVWGLSILHMLVQYCTNLHIFCSATNFCQFGSIFFAILSIWFNIVQFSFAQLVSATPRGSCN